MDYLSDKVNSFASNAMSEVRNRWINRADSNQTEAATNSTAPPSATAEVRPAAAPFNGRHSDSTPLGGGIPFGGDSHTASRGPFPPPPPIGFRTDLVLAPPTNSHQALPGDRGAQSLRENRTNSDRALPPSARLDASSESLYEGDAWSRLWFQRVMVLCLLRLLLFIRKVYEDFQATKVYSLTGQRGHFIIAATTLFLPTVAFTVYRVSRYLQLTLPPLRTKGQELKQAGTRSKTASIPQNISAAASNRQTDAGSDDDAQLSRALMSSPDQSGGMATPVGGNEDEGLVTARQTPTNLEEFHDSKSQQGSTLEIVAEKIEAPPRPPPRRLNVEPSAKDQPKLESVNVDKLGDLPDRDTVRVFVGASEQLLHGVLFVFWQLKRQVDVMGYLVERACLWRKPAEREKDELNRMNCHRDGLEWFQDFYAAFLAILAQVYTLGLHWSSSTEGPMDLRRVSATQLNAASNSLSAPEAVAGSDNSISQSARVLSNLLNTQSLAGKDVLLMSELIVSSAVVLSLLICVRRRDDGPLTLGLSMIGWGSLFAARIIIIALAFVHIGWLIMAPLVILHILCITGWIYKIALDSHNNQACELDDAAKWDEEAAVEQQRQREEAIELAEAAKASQADADSPLPPAEDQLKRPDHRSPSPTSNWSLLEHLVLLSQILTLFAVPSLFYWPIMFNLKLHLRPFKYLVLILTQNFLLIPAIWLTISAHATATPGQLYLLGTVGAFSIVGFIFVSLYVACKPSLTEYFARADELFNEADKSGIYYEFCSRVFRMPDLSKGAFKRLMNQTEDIVEEVVDSNN